MTTTSLQQQCSNTLTACKQRPQRHHWARVYHKRYLWPLTISLICACAPPNHNDDSHYAKRIRNTLNVPQAIESLAYQPQTPPRWAQHTETQHSVDLIEFISLTGCDLQQVIGDKNSNLGKHAPTSVALVQTLNFLAAANRCIDHLDASGNTKLAQKIRTAAHSKHQELPLSIGTALFDGPEVSAFWRNPTPKNYPNDLSSNLHRTLEALNSSVAQWLSGDYRVNPHIFEQQLQSLKSGDGGALIHELQQTAFNLSQANAAINQRLVSNPLCPQGTATQAFDYFNNVVTQYFIGEIQPRNVIATKRANEVFSAFRHLENQLQAGESEPYRQWRQTRATQVNKAILASKHHVIHIKKLWQQCGHNHPV